MPGGLAIRCSRSRSAAHAALRPTSIGCHDFWCGSHLLCRPKIPAMRRVTRMLVCRRAVGCGWQLLAGSSPKEPLGDDLLGGTLLT